METLRFKTVTWEEHPEEFRIRMETAPIFSTDAEGKAVYEGMSSPSRVFEVEGVFRGENASSVFKSLMTLLASGEAGELEHPVWGTFSAVLTQARMEKGSRRGCIFYTLELAEADSAGQIIVLPKYSELWMNNLISPEADA